MAIVGELQVKLMNVMLALRMLDPQGAAGEVKEGIKTTVNEGERKGQGLC